MNFFPLVCVVETSHTQIFTFYKNITILSHSFLTLLKTFFIQSFQNHIDILLEHQTFLGFSWIVNFLFLATVLLFGLSSAPYIYFYCRSSSSCQILEESCCENNSLTWWRPWFHPWFLVSFPMTSNQFGSQLCPFILSPFLQREFSVPVQVIDSICSQYPYSAARKLVQLVGSIISMGFVFGNITRIMTRYSHFDILRSPTVFFFITILTYMYWLLVQTI